MKKHHILLTCTVFLCGLLFGGCQREVERPEIPVTDQSGVITTQTHRYPLTESQLSDRTFYVLHNGMYYNLWNTMTNYDLEDDFPSIANPNRLTFFTTETEVDIPTLFLGNGDKLIYYSESTLLDYLTWEHCADLGYTIGLHNIDTMTNGRCVLPTGEDTDNIVYGSELNSLYDLKKDILLLDKLGGVQLRADYLMSDIAGVPYNLGFINNLKRGETYDLEVYTGTQFKHYLATANIRVFAAMELFASIEYETKQGAIYEIAIPDYFKDGYYNVSQSGLLRIIHGVSYTNNDLLNEPILQPGEEDTLFIYSAFEPLNRYASSVPGSLGYVPPESESVIAGTESSTGSSVLDKIQAATIVEYDLFFPEDTLCSVTITSKEKTGDCYIRTNDKVYPLTKEGDVYSVTIDGKGHTGTLFISGFVSPVSIQYEGCYRE